MCKKRGFEVVEEMKYSEFKIDGKCPFENIDYDHSSGVHFVKSL